MNRHNIIYLSLILVLCISCSKTKRNTYDVDLLNDAVDSIDYSLFVDSVRYINLETTDSCLIGKVTDIAISTDRIFVLDKYYQIIWVFNKTGKFLNKISKRGDGPQEYVNLCQFEYDEKKAQIIALDLWTSYLLFYKVDGKFIKKIKMNIAGYDFKLNPHGGFILSKIGTADTTAGVYCMDDFGRMTKKIAKRNNNHFVDINSEWELCSYDDTICFMAPNFENTVYHIEAKGVTSKYPFKIRPALKHDYKHSISLEHFDDFIRTEYIEGRKWILASYWSSNDGVRRLLFSKDKNKYWIAKSLKNDLDGVECEGKTSVSRDNMFIFWCNNKNPDGNPILQILYLKSRLTD